MVNNEDQKITLPRIFDYEAYETANSIEKIEICLNYINAKLDTGFISLMVGAGFSLNANRKKNTNEQQYEDWAHLLIDAYKELYPNNKECLNSGDSNKIVKKIWEVGESEIATQYEKLKGPREFLDLYIENKFLRINKNTDDLDLHKRLLSLKWGDIFTTNWDDLLERANSKREIFTTIIRAKDLSSRNINRIIKLNGSIRKQDDIDKNSYTFDDTSEYLYVITTKDFENYTKQHEDFSNFMKVKILESPLCLIGFSGRDLNFRYWIKELKRTMQKGGNTKKPNPIFLFDVNPTPVKPEDIEYEKALDLFYHNNYIIRIKVLEYYQYINSRNKVITNSNTPLKSQINSELTHYQLNSFLLKQLYTQESFNQEIFDENQVIISKTDDSYNIIRNIAISNDNELSEVDVEQYNKIPLFIFQNLSNTSSFIYKIQTSVINVSKWNHKTYLFLYKWCLSNYYSLLNIFGRKQIENIIERYIDGKYFDTEASCFVELIFKYYRESKLIDDFNKLLELIKLKNDLNNIINYEKALFLIDSLKYKELKDLLRSWKPEQNKRIDSLFIMRKISLFFMFENMRFFEDSKDDINTLFQIAIKNCGNEFQLKYFILISHRYYLSLFGYSDKYEYQDELNCLASKGYLIPMKFVNEFHFLDKNETIRSNSKTRYSQNSKSTNKEILNCIRCFNFLEYTGLPVSGILTEDRLFKLIPSIKDTDYYLRKNFIYSISLFGNDSDEEFLSTISPKILQYTSKEEIETIFNCCLDILKYKINNLRNARVYIFLLSELSKRVNTNLSKTFFDYLYHEIFTPSDKNEQIKNCIKRGSVWGIKNPFVLYLRNITDEKVFSTIFKWIMKEYIKEEDLLIKSNSFSESVFFNYYFELIMNDKMSEVIKKTFTEIETKEILNRDMGLKIQLSLYAYKYIDDETKNRLLQIMEDHISLKTDPFFITVFKSEKMKDKILAEIENRPLNYFNSAEYSDKNFILALNQVELLSMEDKLKICHILLTKYSIAKNNPDYFKYSHPTVYSNLIESYFIILETITSKKERQDNSELNNAYEVIHTEFIKTLKLLYTFNWIYSESLEDFKINFLHALTCFSYLHQAKKYLYIINTSLTKLIVQDDKNFEAVIEQFVKVYLDYENGIFINKTTSLILIQLMDKFRMEIPFCYDDLFIKEQMKKLAIKMKSKKINDKVIDFWIEQDIKIYDI